MPAVKNQIQVVAEGHRKTTCPETKTPSTLCLYTIYTIQQNLGLPDIIILSVSLSSSTAKDTI